MLKKELTTMSLPEMSCPACGGKMEPVWVTGEGNNHYGHQCKDCAKTYVVCYSSETENFSLRTAALTRA